MGQAVEQGGGHLGVAEDRGPFAEAEIGRDGHACFLVELAQQMEQQGSAGSTEWQISQFVEDHEIELGQVFCNLPGLALGLFLLESVDQLDRGEEADLSAMMFDGLDTKCGGDMGFAGARPADQNDVMGKSGSCLSCRRACPWP